LAEAPGSVVKIKSYLVRQESNYRDSCLWELQLS